MHNAEDDERVSLQRDAFSQRFNAFVFTDGDGSWPVMTEATHPDLNVTFTVLNTERVQERLIEAEGE